MLISSLIGDNVVDEVAGAFPGSAESTEDPENEICGSFTVAGDDEQYDNHTDPDGDALEGLYNTLHLSHLLRGVLVEPTLLYHIKYPFTKACTSVIMKYYERPRHPQRLPTIL